MLSLCPSKSRFIGNERTLSSLRLMYPFKNSGFWRLFVLLLQPGPAFFGGFHSLFMSGVLNMWGLAGFRGSLSRLTRFPPLLIGSWIFSIICSIFAIWRSNFCSCRLRVKAQKQVPATSESSIKFTHTISEISPYHPKDPKKSSFMKLHMEQKRDLPSQMAMSPPSSEMLCSQPWEPQPSLSRKQPSTFETTFHMVQRCGKGVGLDLRFHKGRFLGWSKCVFFLDLFVELQISWYTGIVLFLVGFIYGITLPKTNGLPLKIGRDPKRESHSKHRFSAANMLVSGSVMVSIFDVFNDT